MKNLIILFFAALLVITTSCEKVIEPKDLPEQDPRLVANSILYPDSVITAKISLSKSILSGKDYKLVDNAVCEVYEDDSFIGNLALAAKGSYTSNLMPKTGRRYTLKIAASGYDGISATTSLPGNVSISNIERYDTANYMISVVEYSTGPSMVSRFLQGSLKYKFRVIDDLTARNYYSVRPVAVLTDMNDNVTVLRNTYISSVESGLGNENIDSYGGSIAFDDQAIVNGKDIQLDVSISFNETLDFSSGLKSVRVYLELYNLSPEYYRYLITLNNQFDTGASFFAEPVQVYSNVSNGMGIVAGVNTNSVLIYPQ